MRDHKDAECERPGRPGLSPARRVIVVPRWGGTPKNDWYPWIRQQRPEFDVLDLPDPDTPTIAAWPPRILEELVADRDSLARTIVVGHSVGCQAVLRALAMLPDGEGVHAVLCVAGWWEVDEPWDTILPWMETPDLARIKNAAGSFHVLLSTNDPFTADYEANAARWRSRLGAEVTVVPDAKHFNAAEEPRVLAALEQLI